jgi:uroporphyrin-III C-methyltransferase
MSRCAELGAALIAGGRDAATPAAVVQHACTSLMRSHLTTLGRLSDDVRELGLASPAVIVVGEVVRVAAAWGKVAGAADDVQRLAGTNAVGALAS